MFSMFGKKKKPQNSSIPTNGGIALLLVDVQNDFHPPNGSLAVSGADEDAERIASFISKYGQDKIARIISTMDTHHELHIAHGAFWKDADGKHPDPFTLIHSKDIKSGKWTPTMPRMPSEECYMEAEHVRINKHIFENYEEVIDRNEEIVMKKYCVEYTKLLESSGRFTLIIWPDHCIVGTEGHNVVPSVRKAMSEWSKTTGNSVEWVHKGQNLFTEMYSALEAEVPVGASTSFNGQLQTYLMQCERVFVAGQALSHCVNFTVRDMIKTWPKDRLCDICILTDCASSVSGFEESGEKFLKDMKEAGLTLCTTETAFDDKVLIDGDAVL